MSTFEIQELISDLAHENKMQISSENLLKFIDRNAGKENIEEKVTTIIKKLITNLSSKDSNIQGNSYATLHLVLQLFPSYLPMIVKTIFNYFAKKEHSQNEYGYILGYGALLRSGATSQNKKLTATIIEKIIGRGKELMLHHPSKIMSIERMIAEITLPYLMNEEQVNSVLTPVVKNLVENSDEFFEENSNESVEHLKVITSGILNLFQRNSGEESFIQTTVLKALINQPGTVRFDKVTGTRVLQDAGKFFTPTTVKTLAEELCLVMNAELDRNKAKVLTGQKCPTNNDLIQAAQWLSLLTHHPSLSSSNHIQWKAKQTAFLLRITVSSKHNDKTQILLKQAYMRAFSQSLKELECQLTFVESVVKKFNSALEKHPLDFRLTPEGRLIWKDVVNQLGKLQEKDKMDLKDHMIFRLLYCHLGLQLFLESEGVLESIEDLNSCYKKAFDLEKENNDTLCWTEVIMDVLISLLSKGDNFWRKVVISIFRHIVHLIKPESLTLITDVLTEEKENVFETDSQIISDDENESDEEENEESDEEDVELEEENYSDADEELSDEEDVESDMDKKTILKLQELQQQMQACLHLGMDDLDLDSVPEKEMKYVDNSLGPLIKEYIQQSRKGKNHKKKAPEDVTILLHFRLRICDLFEVLVEESPSAGHLLCIISPLITTIQKINEMNSNEQMQLSKRLQNILLKLCKVKKYERKESVAPEVIVQQLNTVFEIGFKSPGNLELRRIVSSLCTFLVMLGLHTEGPKNFVMNAYLKHLHDFLFTKYWALPGDVLTGPFRMNAASINLIINHLMECAFLKPARLHRRMKAFEFLKKLFQNVGGLLKMAEDDVLFINKTISENVPKMFESVESVEDIKVKLMRNLLDLLTTIHFVYKKNKNLDIEFDWVKVSNSIKDFYSRVDITSMRELNSVMKNVSKHLKISLSAPSSCNITKSKKRTAEDVHANDHNKKQKKQTLESKKISQNEEKSAQNNKNNTQMMKEKRKKKLQKRNKNRRNLKEASAALHKISDFENYSFAAEAVID